jgi:hypothetical protein
MKIRPIYIILAVVILASAAVALFVPATALRHLIAHPVKTVQQTFAPQAEAPQRLLPLEAAPRLKALKSIPEVVAAPAKDPMDVLFDNIQRLIATISGILGLLLAAKNLHGDHKKRKAAVHHHHATDKLEASEEEPKRADPTRITSRPQ